MTGVMSVKGSVFSCLGVGVGEGSFPCVDQKCFFLGGGLPDEEIIGDPDADKGLLGILRRLSASGRAQPEKSKAASAVFGLRSAGASVMTGLVDMGDSRMLSGRGLARELILLDREWPPRTVELLLSVSEEIIDRGLGITSTVSEKSTVLDLYVDIFSLRLGEAGGDLLEEIECL